MPNGNFTAEQLRNASLIYSVGRQMGMSSRDIQIGLMAAMVESNLINVRYGDRDSLGLFQQRPSQGWGSPEQVLNPAYAAGKFFKALRGLGDRRNQMSMGAAAQAVQRSAYPSRYSARIGDVRAIWPSVAQGAGDPQQSIEGGPYQNVAYNPNKLSGYYRPGEEDAEDSPQLTADDMLGPSGLSEVAADDSPVGPNDGADMLSAWAADQTRQQDTNPYPSIGPGTNQIIKNMSQEVGGYEKGVDGWRKAAVQVAQRYVGTPYVWGGTSPDGFDCSGFVQYVMGKAGKRLPRISYQQANAGKRVPLNQLRPGDLVAWDNSPRNAGADHIAIYLGNGQIIEAPRPGLSVRVRSLGKNEGAWGVSLG